MPITVFTLISNGPQITTLSNKYHTVKCVLIRNLSISNHNQIKMHIEEVCELWKD